MTPAPTLHIVIGLEATPYAFVENGEPADLERLLAWFKSNEAARELVDLAERLHSEGKLEQRAKGEL